MTLSLRDAAREAPLRIALVDDEGALTWDEVARAAAALTPESPILTARARRADVLRIWSLLDARTPFALLHARWTDAERDEARARVQASRHPAQVVVFTSGSTGKPKGVRLSAEALGAAAEAHARALPWQPDDRWLLAMPLGHVGGLSILTRALWSRGAVALGPERFDPDTFHAASSRLGVTLLSLVPTMLDRLLEDGRPPPPRLRAALLGGAACPPALLRKGREAGWPLLPTYGTSETCAQIATQRLDDPRPEGVGPPLPGVRVRVRDGAIEVAGPTLFDGLLEEARSGTWYRTGDLGHLDEDGHLHVAGRVDDRIVSGGENVDPLEVEAALRAHPAVRDACVVGVPDPRWGQRVAAMVVGEVSVAELEAHLAPRLARFKHPRRWRFAEALPVAPSGKRDRRAVAAALERST